MSQSDKPSNVSENLPSTRLLPLLIRIVSYALIVALIGAFIAYNIYIRRDYKIWGVIWRIFSS
jgi:hypothetical protein